jgi:hypothetical protein
MGSAQRDAFVVVVTRAILTGVVAATLLTGAWLVWSAAVVGPESDRGRRALCAVQEIANGLFVAIKEGKPLPLSLEDVIERLRANKESCVVHGVLDPWGSRYVFDIMPNGNGGGILVITVRSFGRNRRDDLGEGDDIRSIVEVITPGT